MNYKLVIAEKPSVAASISAVLNAKKREDGFFIGNGYIVSWCVGHLVELATADTYNEKYAKWRYEDLPIIPTAWKYAVPKDKKKQFALHGRGAHHRDTEQLRYFRRRFISRFVIVRTDDTVFDFAVPVKKICQRDKCRTAEG